MPAAGLENLSGSKIFAAVGEPATFTLAGYEALTWVEVIGIVSFGEWGDTQADVSEPIVGDNRVIHTNGINDGGEVPIVVQHRAVDLGMTLLKANSGADDPVSFKKLYKSGDGEYASGIVTTSKMRPLGSDGIRGRTINLRVNTAVLEATAAEIAAV